MTLNGYLATLIAYAKKYLALDGRDVHYARNRLLDALHKTSYREEEPSEVPALPDGIIEGIFRCLDEEGIEYDSTTLGEKLMDAVMPRPGEYERLLALQPTPEEKTAWAYAFAVHSDYVKKSAIDKNIKWTGSDGSVEITINLSKPEKNNRDLKKQLQSVSTDYPKCTICHENEGYERSGFTRRNMRTHAMTLNGEEWFWQYSPYAYFNEHGILISEEHTPMVLDGRTAENLFCFLDEFPHYFIGNNAPLPRVGGSILMHNHYQGGRAELPMHRATTRLSLYSARHPAVRAGVLDWYNTALRLEGEDRYEVAALAEEIFTAWENYDAPALDILSRTGEERHNTASLIARRTKEGYLLDLILRNNRTSGEHPDGIFHAHREYHHIKRESIGLIEAMGLFILPARLQRQLGEVKEYLTGKRAYRREALDGDMQPFAPMIERLLPKDPLPERAAEEAIRREVERVAKAILCNTAVFKRDGEGEKGLMEFLETCGLKGEKV